ncbi:MAG: beta-N-acetylglucosaminidase domain-containing protein [Armatimonadota bacterium]|nr:beta-N-acetylglucosaminidase domain-containing protein [Armatimonadota bacterium]
MSNKAVKVKVMVILLLFVLSISALNAGAFKIRGIKGLWWQGIEKYQLALPWLAEHNLNFLMLCYSSFPASGMDWRSQYTPEEKKSIAELVEKGRKLGVDICLSFNPGIWSNPPLVYSSDSDYEIAINKVKDMHAVGVRWFALCLDDINRELQPEDKAKFGNLAAAQIHFVNRLWDGMKNLKPRPKLIFCPSAYLTADMQRHMDYVEAIGKGIDPDVMMFWTGPQCCSPSITADDARLVAKWIRRKPFVWDNYPVNDMFPWRPLLSPLKNRSADLAGAVSGYIANPMKQWYASTIPLATTAAYLNDPEHYEPSAAMEKLIRSYPADQQRTIRLLVELYGCSFWGEKNWPPQPFDRRQAKNQLPKYRALKTMLSLNPNLKNLWEDVRDTVEQDIALLEKMAEERHVSSRPKCIGVDFEGGAASIFGWFKYGRLVNYVYARPTCKDEMHAELLLDTVPSGGASLKVTGRNDDLGVNGKICIKLNNYAVYEGPANFSTTNFETKEFNIPSLALKKGANVLSIQMTENQGTLGMPPWFMVAEVELVPI